MNLQNSIYDTGEWPDDFTTTNMILISERAMEHDKEINRAFIDLEKAFDKVNWAKLLQILQQLGIDWKDRGLIRNLYIQQTVCVRINNELTKPGGIG